jgi:hypothetical protein
LGWHGNCFSPTAFSKLFFLTKLPKKINLKMDWYIPRVERLTTMFTFKKIRETIIAFKPKRKTGSDYQMPDYSTRFTQTTPNTTINKGIIIMIIFPILWLFNYIIESFLRSCGTATTTGLSAIILTAIYAFFHDRIRNKVFQKIFQTIPFYKLNPYFGNKIEETIQAYKKTKQVNR